MNHLIEEGMKRRDKLTFWESDNTNDNILPEQKFTQLEQEAWDRGDYLYWDNPGYEESDEIKRLEKQIKALNLLLSELNEDIETTYKMNRAMAKLLKKLL